MIKFSDLADLIKEKYGIRCHVNFREQTITLFEEGTGKCYILSLTEKRFSA